MVTTMGLRQAQRFTRLADRTQIVKKTAAVSGTTKAVNLYGTKSELAFQMAKKSKELKRDMETIMMGKQASTAGSASVAAKLGSLQGYMSATIGNIVYSGAKGSATTPGWSAGNTGAIVDPSATAALDETKFKSLVKTCYDNGAENADVLWSDRLTVRKQVPLKVLLICTRNQYTPDCFRARNGIRVYFGLLQLGFFRACRD